MKFEKIIRKTKSMSVNISSSKIDSLRTKSDTQTTYRAYDNNCIGVAGRIGSGNDEELKQEAIAKLTQGIPYPCNLTGGKKAVDARKKIIAENAYLKTLNAFLVKLEKEFPDFLFYNKINMTDKDLSYTNSEGADYSYKANNIMVSVVIKDKQSANIMDAAVGVSTNYFDEEKLLEDFRQTLTAFRNKIELPEENLPVIIDSSVASLILKEFVAEVYAGGAGLLKGRLGEKVFSEKVSIILNRDPENAQGIPFFDLEGVVMPDYKTCLVENGVFKKLLTTKRSASMYGYELSGSAAGAYDSVPAISAEGLDFAFTADHISKLTNKAIYVSIASGGDITPSGDVGMPVQLALLYENGKLVGRLPELMLSGNIFDILGKNFIGSTENSWMKHSKDTLLVTHMDIKKQK